MAKRIRHQAKSRIKVRQDQPCLLRRGSLFRMDEIKNNDNRTRLLIRAALPNFFSTRGLWKRGPQKRVARAQKLVVADLP